MVKQVSGAALVATGLLSLSTAAFSQNLWQSLISPVRGVAISEDGEKLIAVGDHGSVLYSDDGARSWSRPFFSSHQRFEDVETLTDDAIVIVGEAGSLWFSTDNAMSWSSLGSQEVADHRLHRIQRIGQSNGAVILGDSSLFLLDLDQQSIRPVPEVDADLKPIGAVFYSVEEGLAVIESQGVFRTTDGGGSWIRTFADTAVMESDVAASPNGAYSAAISSDGGLLVSVDSGRSWSVHTSTVPISPVRLAVNDQGVVALCGRRGETGSETAARFLIDSSRWVWSGLRYNRGEPVSTDVDISREGRIIIGGDEGLVATIGRDTSVPTLYHEPIPRRTSPQYIGCANDSICMYSTSLTTGNARTTDAGTTWTRWELSGVDLDPIWFLENGKGVTLLSEDFRAYDLDNYGARYHPFSIDVEKPFSSDTYIVGASRMDLEGNAMMLASVLGTNGLAPLYLFRTTDTLRSLSCIKIPTDDYVLRNHDFRCLDLGLIVVYKQTPGSAHASVRLYRTLEAGQTLELVSEHSNQSPFDWDVAVHSRTRAFRPVQLDDTTREESAHMLMESNDAGETWEPFYRFDGPVHLSFLSDSIWMAGSNRGRIWTTYDAGTTWQLEQIDPAPVVTFANGTVTYYPEFIEAIVMPDSITVLMRGNFGLFFRKRLPGSLSSVGSTNLLSSSDHRISVQPSESATHVNVVWESLEVRSMKVYSMIGECVEETVVGDRTEALDLRVGHLPSGIYQIILLDGSGRWIGTTRFRRL